MKKVKFYFQIMLVVILTNQAIAQNDSTYYYGKNDDIKTLFGPKISHGAYIGFSTYYSEINGKETLETGGRIGWIIDHCLTIGFEGMGFANSVVIDDIIHGYSFDIVGGYGGIFFEPIVFPKFPVHVAFPITLGVGGVAYSNGLNWSEAEYIYDQADAFLLVKPGVELELNVIKYFRVALGVNYKIAYDVDIPNVKKDVLNGLSGGVTFKLGKF